MSSIVCVRCVARCLQEPRDFCEALEGHSHHVNFNAEFTFSGPAPIVHSALASATSNSRWAFRVWRCALGNHRCPHHTPRCLGCLCAAMLPKVCPNIWPCGPEKVDRTPAPLAHMNAVLPRSLGGLRMLRRWGQGGSRARAAASECVGALRCRYSRCWCISGWCEVGAPALTAVV